MSERGGSLRRLLLLALAALAGPAAGARAGVLTKVRDNGPDSNRVVMLIVAEGYTAAQQAAFDADAEATLVEFFGQQPWASYAGHANVYTDFVASNESGADKPAPCYSPEVFRDTAFGARYCGFGTQRLLLVNEGAVWSEVLGVLPGADLVGVLVGDPEYGGAGGSLLTFSTHASARGEIFIHEQGHTFANLADEYTTAYPGFPPGDPEPNVDFDSTRGSIDWDPWIDAATPLPTPNGTAGVVGAFEGARYLTTGIYRPMNDCKMRSLGRAFCPACSEAIVQSIYAVVRPIDGVSPAGPVVGHDACDGTTPVALSVTPLLPADPSWIAATWEIDGVVQPETGFTLERTGAELGTSVRRVAVTLTDVTPLVRRRFLSPMSSSYQWFLDPAAGPDRDADGATDACDCAPDDPAVGAPPSLEVPLLRVDRPATLSWGPVAAAHDVARGDVDVLHATGVYSGACLPADGTGSLADPASPAPARGFWYLVRGRATCGAGPWGPRGDGATRDVVACP